MLPIDWDTWQKNNVVTSYYEDVVVTKDVIENSSDYKQQLFNAIPEQRETLLINQITQQVGNILGIKDLNAIDLELGFSELGLDSLGSVELRNKLQSSYDLKLSQTVIFDYSNIRQLAKHLISLIFDRSISQSDRAEENIDLEKLSEAEAEAALLAELEKIDD